MNHLPGCLTAAQSSILGESDIWLLLCALCLWRYDGNLLVPLSDRDHTDGVRVTGSGLPSRYHDYRCTNLHHSLLKSGINGKADTTVHVLRPIMQGSLLVVQRIDAPVQVQLTSRLGIPGHCKDRTAWTIGSHQLSRAAGVRHSDDCHSQAVDRSLYSSQGSRVGDVGGAWSQKSKFLKELLVVNGRLGLFGDLVHCLDSLQRIAALGCLTRQHHAVGAIENGVGN